MNTKIQRAPLAPRKLAANVKITLEIKGEYVIQ
jgi:hypothetical protein